MPSVGASSTGLGRGRRRCRQGTGTWPCGARSSEDFPEDCARFSLSDNAVRTHLEALVWAMRRENDGRLFARDLSRLADSSDPVAAADELVAVGFWTQLPDGWQIEHQMEHQPESDVIAARRSLNAERQRKKRRTAAGLTPPDPDKGTPYPRDDHRDDQRDDTRDPERNGTERNGTERLGEGVLGDATSHEKGVTSDYDSSTFRRRFSA